MESLRGYWSAILKYNRNNKTLMMKNRCGIFQCKTKRMHNFLVFRLEPKKGLGSTYRASSMGIFYQ